MQTRALERRLSEVPDAIVPTEPPPDDGVVLRVTVLPEAVVVVVGAGGATGRGAGVVARPVVLGRVVGVELVRIGVDLAGAGAGAGVVVAGVAGTSRS